MACHYREITSSRLIVPELGRAFASCGRVRTTRNSSNDLDEQAGLNRLADIVDAAGRQALLAFATHRMRRERDHRGWAAVGAQLLGGLVAIQNRHLDIHQDDVKCTGFGGIHRLLSILDDRDVCAAVFDRSKVGCLARLQREAREVRIGACCR